MSKTVRLSSIIIIIAVLLFIVGVLVGQRGGRSKFDKYTQSSSVTQMQVSILQANVRVLKSYLPLEVPQIYYD